MSSAKVFHELQPMVGARCAVAGRASTSSKCRLTHPRFEHEKIYIVRAAGRWNEEKLRVLRGPVEMPDGYVTRPVPVEVVRLGDDNVHVLCFHLREGRKRQIRYMCSAAHLVVLSLKRVAVGALRLPDDLKPGEWRDLSSAEVEAALSRAVRRRRE